MTERTVDPWCVFAVWCRHFHVYRKTWLYNLLPPVSEPIVYLVAFGLGLQPLIGEFEYLGHKVEYIPFIAPGMIGVGVLFQSFFEGAYGSFIRLTYQRTWHAILTAPVSFADVFFGDWLWAATRGVIAGVLTGCVAVIWGVMTITSLLSILPVIVFGGLLFGALGLISAGWSKRIDQINIPVFLIVVPMFALCGTYFPRQTLPPLMRTFADLLPFSSLVDLLRGPIHPIPDPMRAWLLLFLWTSIFATISYRKIRKKIYR